MKVQLRRWVTIGLMSGSLAISALAGGAAVGASAANDERDNYVILSGQTPVFTEEAQSVTIVSAGLAAPATDQMFNHDARS